MCTHNQDLRNVEDCDAVFCPLSLPLMYFCFDSNSNSYQGPGFFLFYFIPLLGPTEVSFYMRIRNCTLYVVFKSFITAILNRFFCNSQEVL